MVGWTRGFAEAMSELRKREAQTAKRMNGKRATGVLKKNAAAKKTPRRKK